MQAVWRACLPHQSPEPPALQDMPLIQEAQLPAFLFEPSTLQKGKIVVMQPDCHMASKLVR